MSFVLNSRSLFLTKIYQAKGVEPKKNGLNHLVLAMLSIFGWQHCNGIASKSFFSFLTELGNFKQNFFRGNAIGNVANQNLTALLRADDLGQYSYAPFAQKGSASR